MGTVHTEHARVSMDTDVTEESDTRESDTRDSGPESTLPSGGDHTLFPV